MDESAAGRTTKLHNDDDKDNDYWRLVTHNSRESSLPRYGDVVDDGYSGDGVTAMAVTMTMAVIIIGTDRDRRDARANIIRYRVSVRPGPGAVVWRLALGRHVVRGRPRSTGPSAPASTGLRLCRTGAPPTGLRRLRRHYFILN